MPNLAVALLALGSLPFVLFFVPETLRVKRVGVVVGESTDANPRYESMRLLGKAAQDSPIESWVKLKKLNC